MSENVCTVVVHQPDFVPYLGFFHRLLRCDVWVVLDHVQLNKEGWVHRDQIKTAYGVKWLSIPLKKSPLAISILETEVSSMDWRGEHMRKLHEAYRKAARYRAVLPLLEDIYACEDTRLSQFTLHALRLLLTTLDIQVPRILYSSDMEPQASSNALVAELTLKAGGTRYLSGLGARNYFDPAPYAAGGIEVVWQEFTHPVYPQLHGDFVPFLTCLDLLCNCGVDGARKIVHAL